MRNACTQLTKIAAAFVLFAAFAALARSQTRDPRLVSARAGGVNQVTGDVAVRRAGRQSWETLLRTDELRDGDAVRTGSDGRAEILLNPGSYLRLGENTEFEMTDTSLNTARLKIARGSALVEALIPEVGASRTSAPAPKTQAATVIEAAARDSASFVILIDAPKTQALIVRSGVYRINVAPDGTTEIVVRSGRALVGREAVVVKDGRAASVGAGGAVEVAKFDGKQKDALDLWARKRAEEIARANNRLQTRALNTMLAGMNWNGFNWGPSPTGFWTWNSTYEFYTFIPFFGCRSAYGFAYNTTAPGLLRFCDCYGGYDYRPNPYIVNRGNGGSTWHGNGGGGSTNNNSGGGSTGGGGTLSGGGSTLGGGNTVSRPPAESPATTTQHSGGGSAHRIEPPL